MSDRKVRDLLEEFDRLAAISNTPGVMTLPVRDFANALRRALDAPEAPQIVRTVEELEALDPETPLMIGGAEAMTWDPRDLIRFKLQGGSPFPAVVVATADQVRAARRALEEA